jgi:hypothetical protein
MANGAYQILGSFDPSGPNGPLSGLVAGSNGLLYGTTFLGGLGYGAISSIGRP